MDVYDIANKFIELLEEKHLMNHVARKFRHLSKYPAKTNYLEQLLIDHHFLDTVFLSYPLREPKCNQKCISFRVSGNEEFAKGNYTQAMELYNKSICYAETNTDNYYVSFSNRSAVLYEWRCYRECLQNIEIARQGRYPEKLREKLDKREEKCNRLLGLQPEEREPHEFILCTDPHPVVPFIADCLELRENDVAGRHVCTTQELIPGDMVAIESPFCTSILPSHRYIRCANCSKENYYSLIPCDKCCCTMFCSEECREKANATFHKYECPIVNFLLRVFNETHEIGLKVCLTLIEHFPNIQQLMAFCNNPHNKKKTVFDLNYADLTPQESYRAVHGLSTNEMCRPHTNIFERCIITAVLKHFLFKFTPILEYVGGTEGQNLFTDLLFRHLQTASINMHLIGFVSHVNKTDNQAHTVGCFPFISMLNHSCAPNTLRVTQGTKFYLFILRTIPAGGVLYDNYGPHFSVASREARRHQLSTRYFFYCNCDACLYDFPDLFHIESKPHIPYPIHESDMQSIEKFDFDYALHNYMKYCEFLHGFESFYPCDQLGIIEQCLKKTLLALLEPNLMK